MRWRALGLWGLLLLAVAGALAAGRLRPATGAITYRLIRGDHLLHDPATGLVYRVWQGGAWSPGGRWWYDIRQDDATLVIRLTTPTGREALTTRVTLPGSGHPNAPVSSQFVFSADETRFLHIALAREADNNTVERAVDVIDVADGNRMHYQPAPTTAARTYHWDPSGRLVAELYRASNPGGLFQLGLTLLDTETGTVQTYNYSEQMSFLAPELGGWSRDGQWLAFIGGRADERERSLYVAGRDGALTRVSREGTIGLNYAWHPTRPLVAYSEAGRRVAVYDAGAGAAVAVIDTGNDTIAHPLAWTPDGDGLLVRWLVGAEMPSSRQHVGLWRAGVLTELDTFDGGVGVVRWSPDGTQALLGVRDRGQTDIYRFDARNGTLRPLTEQGVTNTDPHWSPDGAWVMFSSERDGPRAVYLMRPDGTAVRRVSPVGEQTCCAGWVTLD